MMDIDFTSDEINVSSNPSMETKFEEKLDYCPEFKATKGISGQKRTSDELGAERYICFDTFLL